MNPAQIEALARISTKRINETKLDFKRYLYASIGFDSRIILIKGCRGVGKSTLLLQALKEVMDDTTSIYISLDHIYFASTTLYDCVESCYDLGYRTFVFDEVHKYTDWSIEIKNVYDSYSDVKIMATASSALDIMKGAADLSRRADVYHLRGLSFREYLMMESVVDIPIYTFEEILAKHVEIYDTYFEQFQLKKHFKKYLSNGIYPFFKEAGSRYHERLLSVINQVIEVDLPAIFNVNYESTRQIKKLLAMLGRIAPYTPNIANLSRDLSMSRTSVLTFMDYLESADLLHILKSNAKSDSALTKPDKVYLENTNLLYALGNPTPDSGMLRETFVMNALSMNNQISTPARGDLLVDNKYTVEIGGPKKDFHQISNMPNPILIKEGIEQGSNGIIPMWMLGLMW
ncbi:MAG: ATP-binding protein [Saprospiraceae bacterium]|nr:ATP-binding protein [Saprospiraceae bacterium]MBK8634900.1 ATP-binding protein [Saprospiraceae bacterium]